MRTQGVIKRLKLHEDYHQRKQDLKQYRVRLPTRIKIVGLGLKTLFTHESTINNAA